MLKNIMRKIQSQPFLFLFLVFFVLFLLFSFTTSKYHEALTAPSGRAAPPAVPVVATNPNSKKNDKVATFNF